MYALVYTKTGVGKFDQCKTPDLIKVYYCKNKKLASHYLINRFIELVKMFLIKKDARIISAFIAEDNESACISYKAEGLVYSYIKEEFRIVKGSEILDLPNGPGIKIE